jgi:hypothetical protein
MPKHNNGLESLDQADPKQWEVPEPLGYLPPKWMSETYPGMEEDVAHDIYSAIFWSTMQKDVAEAEKNGTPPPDMNDVIARSSEIAKTIMAAAEHLPNVKDASERAFYALVYKVKKNNLQQLSKNEYDTIEEWLVDRMETLPAGSGEMSDITFLMGEVFPMLEKIKGGFEPTNLLSLQSYWSKTRAAIPYLRFITNRHKETVNELGHEIEKTTKRVIRLQALQRDRTPTHRKFGPTEARIKELRGALVELNEKQEVVVEKATEIWKEGVGKTLKIIADNEVKPWGKEGERTVKASLFNGEKADIRMYEGFQGVLPGRSLFVLILPSRYERTVQNALSGLVDWKLTDPHVMADELKKAVKTNPFAGDELDDDLR